MTEASSRGDTLTRILHRAASIALLALIVLTAGCERLAQKPEAPRPMDPSHVQIIAWLDSASPCEQGTIEILRELEDETHARLKVRIVDIGTREGRALLEERGLDDTAVEFDGHTTVAWGEGDSRRVVSFMHPAGFTWTHKDLRAAIEAALDGQLHPAEPAEAEGVRLMDISVRGQSIRVGNEGAETGQFVIQDQIVLEITAPRASLAPGQRVAAAARTLSAVLQSPFTPNQLGLERTDDGVAVTASGQQLLTATRADIDAPDLAPHRLADQWRLAIRHALIEAALQRTVAPPPTPVPVPAPAPVAPEAESPVGDDVMPPANALTEPLPPTE